MLLVCDYPIGDLRHAAALGQQAGGIACHHGRVLPAPGLHRADQIGAERTMSWRAIQRHGRRCRRPLIDLLTN